jgi:hypothetical protein
LIMIPCVSAESQDLQTNNSTIPEEFIPHTGIPMQEPPEEALIVPPVSQSMPHWEIWAILALTIIVLNSLLLIRLKRKKAVWLSAILLFAIVSSFPAVLAYDYGSPLNTSDIALFAYYNETSDWTLADTVSAWQEYSDNGNYYDGKIRVWQDVSGSTFDGNDVYIDVYARVRADGWILAWQNQTDVDYGNYPFYGRERNVAASSYPVENSTSLSRAIERVYAAAGKTFVGYDQINYWDYQFTNTKRLMLFGRAFAVGPGGMPYSEEWYFIIPDGVTCEQAWLTCGGAADYSTMYMRIYFDNVQKWGVAGQSGEHGWASANVTDVCTENTKHTVKILGYGNQYARMCGSILIWLS